MHREGVEKGIGSTGAATLPIRMCDVLLLCSFKKKKKGQQFLKFCHFSGDGSEV